MPFEKRGLKWTPAMEARAAAMRNVRTLRAIAAQAEAVKRREPQKALKVIELEKAENKRFGRVDRRVQPRSTMPSTWPAVEASCRIWGLPVRPVSTGFKTAYPPRVYENR